MIVDTRWGLSEDRLKAISQAPSRMAADVSVCPLDAAGRALWKDLPPRLAVLAAPPGATSALVLSDSVAATTPEETWQRLATDNELSWQVCDENAVTPVSEPTLPLLAPEDHGSAPAWLIEHILSANLAGSAAASDVELHALRAGLLQMHDELDLSHQQSQAIEGEGRHRAGDYWHAIMHRREPDYGNSKYWFRRVGSHPIMRTLAEQARVKLEKLNTPESNRWKDRLLSRGWDPFAFVDLCEHCRHDESTPLALAARDIQWMEMVLLLASTYGDATD